MTESLATALAGELRRRGVRRMFGVPGGGSSLDLIEAAAAEGIAFVLARGETAAAIMAATTAELAGTPGVVLTGLGPGAASVTNGLAHAALDRAPLVVVTDAHADATAAFVTHQRLDHGALFAPLVKASLAPRPETTAGDLAVLIDLALAPPRGVVHLDLSVAAASAPTAPGRPDPPPPDRGPPESAEAARARALVAAAERPVLLVGLEARRHAASARRLARRLGGPALCTWKAKGVLPDDDPSFAGLLTGGVAEAACLERADLIVQLGLDPVELIPGPWPYRAPIVDLAETPRAARYAAPAATLLGPLERSAEALLDAEPGRGWAPGEIAGGRAALLGRYRVGAARGIAPQEVVEAALAAAPPGTRATVDAGAHMFPAIAAWPAPQPNAALISNGLATMGFALPAAIASALEEPDRPVVVFTGDAGLAMVLGELATLAACPAAVAVVVFNDAALSLIDLKQRGRGFASRGCATAPLDFATAARALGLAGVRVERLAALAPAVEAALCSRRPTVVDVAVDPSGYPAMIRAVRG